MKILFSMRNNFLDHPFFRKQKKDSSPRDLLIEDILKTQFALEVAYQGFDNALDPDLIDCYIYAVNSALKRYRFLIHQANSMHLFEQENTIPPQIALFKVPMPEILS